MHEKLQTLSTAKHIITTPTIWGSTTGPPLAPCRCCTTLFPQFPMSRIPILEPPHTNLIANYSLPLLHLTLHTRPICAAPGARLIDSTQFDSTGGTHIQYPAAARLTTTDSIPGSFSALILSIQFPSQRVTIPSMNISLSPSYSKPFQRNTRLSLTPVDL